MTTTELTPTQLETLKLLQAHPLCTARRLTEFDSLHEDGRDLGRTLGALKSRRLAETIGEGLTKVWGITALGSQLLSAGAIESSPHVGMSRRTIETTDEPKAIPTEGVDAGADDVPQEAGADDIVFDEDESADAALSAQLGVALGEIEYPDDAKPLPVLEDDYDLHVADELVAVLMAPHRPPANIAQLIRFNRRLAKGIRPEYPVQAAMLECTANALERAFPTGGSRA